MTKAAVLDPVMAAHIQRIAKRTCQALDLTGYARVDLRLDMAAGRVCVLEANPNPNLSYGEDLAESAEASGIPYERLLDRILGLGLRWEPERT
jgi:D-alanine-D-alanine ligase